MTPSRESHFTNEEYLSRWADADKYLATLRAGADTGLLDLSILQIDKYEEALRQSHDPPGGRARTPGRFSTTWRRSGMR